MQNYCWILTSLILPPTQFTRSSRFCLHHSKTSANTEQGVIGLSTHGADDDWGLLLLIFLASQERNYPLMWYIPFLSPYRCLFYSTFSSWALFNFFFFFLSKWNLITSGPWAVSNSISNNLETLGVQRNTSVSSNQRKTKQKKQATIAKRGKIWYLIPNQNITSKCNRIKLRVKQQKHCWQQQMKGECKARLVRKSNYRLYPSNTTRSLQSLAYQHSHWIR